MRSNRVIQGFVLCSALLVAAGCTICRPVKAEKMNILGSALTKLSASVEATVRYEDPPEGSSDKELLALATNHDPGLLAPFSDYTVRVSRQDGHAIVLICDNKGKVALLEDAGCSSELDQHLWKENPPKRCEFMLDANEVCASPEE